MEVLSIMSNEAIKYSWISILCMLKLYLSNSLACDIISEAFDN